jgi:hypothetical protein
LRASWFLLWTLFITVNPLLLWIYKADDHDDEWQVVEVDGDVEDAQYFVAEEHPSVAAGSRRPNHFKRS